MKAILLVSFVLIIESAGEPCSTADHFPVVNICTKETAFDESSNTILVKSDKRQNCTCELSLTDQNQSIIIKLQRFNNLISSHPSNYNCGLIINFSIEHDLFGEANCFGVSSVSRSIEKKDVITISSMTRNGTLQDNEGYCIEIKKAMSMEGNKLNLTCGIGSTLATNTNTTSMTTTTAWTETMSLLSLKTTTPTINIANITIKSDEFNFATGTSVDGIVTTKYVNPYKVDKDNDGTAIYIALVASACGFVIFITIFVLCCKRFRICVNKKSLESNAFYEQVNIPAAANGTDGTSISHNYSSLCMRDVQLSSENRRLCGSHDVPLSIISREIVNEKEINGQSDQYANLVF